MNDLKCVFCTSRIHLRSNYGSIVARCEQRSCGAEWNARGELTKQPKQADASLDAKMPDSVRKVDTRVRRR